MTVNFNRCPQCGRTIRGSSLGGLCPACVARLSLVPGPEPAAGPSNATPVGLGELLPEDILAADRVLTGSGPRDARQRESGPSSGLARFGDYELLAEIGRGGMGIVYRARQIRLNRQVAVKMIPFGSLASEESVRRFRAEAEAVAQLRHPNIIAIHDIGEGDGQHYFSMDYIEGGTLADALRDGPWPARRAAACLETVARAVHHAHQCGLLHRDLKPSNILLDAEGQPRITDFGLARKLAGDSTLTVTGQVLGSPSYMPPEQASGGHAPPGPANDIYSLGAVLYHALTGRPPFQAESLEAVLAQLAMNEPVPPRLLNPGVPRDLETICLRCLTKEPARRYGTAAELADELGRFQRDEPILAKPASRAEKAWRWCRRRPALATSLALLLLVGATGAAGVLWQWRRAEAAGADTARNLYAADMALAYQAFAVGDRGRARELLEAYRPRLDAYQPRTELFVQSGAASYDLRGWEWRYLWRQCRGEEQLTLARHPGAVVALDYSPDGRWLASGDVRGGLQVWDVAGRRLILSTNLSEGRINALAFSPDGRILGHTTARRHVWLWNTRASPWQRIATLTHADVAQLAFAPDSQQLATANGMEVMLWNLETQKPARIIPPSRGRPHPRHVAYSPDGQTLAIADENGMMMYWDLQANTEEASWRAHVPASNAGAAVEGLAFSTGKRRFATASADKTIRLWTAPRHYRPFSNHTDIVTSAVFSPDGGRLVSGSLDQTVRYWDVATQQQLGAWHAHAGGCLKVRFAPDGRTVASSGVDGTVKLWNLKPRPPESMVQALPPQVADVLLFSDPPTLAMTLAGGEWRVWDLPAMTEQHRGRHSTNRNASLKAAARGRMLEFAGRSVHVRPVTAGQAESEASFELGDILSVDLSRDGATLAVSGVNGIAAWDLPTRRELRRWMTPREGWSRRVRLAPDGATIVTLHENDGTVTFLEIASGRTTILEGHMIGRSVLSFSPDGHWLATAGLGADVRLYDLPGQKAVGSIGRTRALVVALAFSPDSTRLACGQSTGLISLWDLETRREVAALEGHDTLIYSLAFLDADTLASATRKEIRFWRATMPGDDRELGSDN